MIQMENIYINDILTFSLRYFVKVMNGNEYLKTREESLSSSGPPFWEASQEHENTQNWALKLM